MNDSGDSLGEAGTYIVKPQASRHARAGETIGHIAAGLTLQPPPPFARGALFGVQSFVSQEPALADSAAELTGPANNVPVKLKRNDPRADVLRRTATAAIEFASGVLAQPAAKNAAVVWSAVNDSAALRDFIEGSRRLVRHRALGRPASNSATQAGFAESAADLLGDFAACYELPDDRVFLWIRLGSQAFGVTAGCIGGQPTMVVANLKSLMNDDATCDFKHVLVKVVMERPAAKATSGQTSTRPPNGPDILELAELAKAFAWTD